MNKVAIVGGTGLYELDFLKESHKEVIETEYGKTAIYRGKSDDREIIFLPRHGIEHGALAYQVNFKANMQALADLNIKKVFATCAAGSLNYNMGVGDIVLLDQFMDLAWNRESTFGEYSVNMTNPYCEKLRNNYIEAADELNIKLHPHGNMIVTGGPRYETALEVEVFKNWGMDVVGMTNSTEATLARELGLCYSAISVVTDMAAGLTRVEPDLALHKKVFNENIQKVIDLLQVAVSKVDLTDEDCSCQEFYKKALEARS